MPLSNDSRTSASRITGRRANIPCTVVTIGDDITKKGEASICMPINKQAEFFCYRSVLLTKGRVPIHWIIPLRYEEKVWRPDQPIILTEEEEQKQEVPKLNAPDQLKLDIIVETLIALLPKRRFSKRTINPSVKSKMKKDFTYGFIESIKSTYYRKAFKLKPVFNSDDYRKS